MYLRLILIFVCSISAITSLSQTVKIKAQVFANESLTSLLESEGRLFLYISERKSPQPRFQTWPGNPSYIYATNLDRWEGKEFTFEANKNLSRSSDIPLDQFPSGTYYLQASYAPYNSEEAIISEDQLYSPVQEITINRDQTFSLTLTEQSSRPSPESTKWVKYITMQSDTLTSWWDRPMKVNFSVLLPSDYYDNTEKTYPVRYNIGGYGSRYTRGGRLMQRSSFSEWWMSSESPNIINVFLDGDGPYGDCYQLNSANSGPYGEVLVKEIIPYVETNFRGKPDPQSRFLDGCSTGGWVSLALQIFYPETFNGTFSYSPDPVTFEHMQLVDLYKDNNAFYNEHHYERPSKRNTYGDPEFSIKREIQFENVVAKTGTYNTSQEQWGAWNALYSPKGKDDIPQMVFDPFSGVINREVVDHWEQYDLKKYLQKNWSTLGPKLKGKIWVWMGDMDEYYLNNALRSFDNFIKNTQNPISDAVIQFSPMQGHCDAFDHREVLEMMAERME